MAEGGILKPRLDTNSIEKALRTFIKWRLLRANGVLDNHADIGRAIDVAIRLLRLARYESQSYGDER